MSTWSPERTVARASRCRCQPAVVVVVVSVVLGSVVVVGSVGSALGGGPGIVLVKWRRVWSPSGRAPR
jgi:hypothetical protein